METRRCDSIPEIDFIVYDEPALNYFLSIERLTRPTCHPGLPFPFVVFIPHKLYSHLWHQCKQKRRTGIRLHAKLHASTERHKAAAR